MKYAHFIAVRIFSYEYDDIDLIKKKIVEMFPYKTEKDKIKTKSKKQIVTDEKVINIISAETKNNSKINKFLKQLMFRLSDGDKRLLLDQLESRLDEGLHYYIRLKKNEFLKGEYELTDGGKCLHIKIAVAAYPHKREVAKKIVEKMVLV